MKNKAVKIFVFALVISVVSYIIYMRDVKSKEVKLIMDVLNGDKTADGKSTSGTDYLSLPAGEFPLKLGDKNQKVFDVQRAINSKYGTNLTLDGKFGDNTARALCKNVYAFCYTDVQARHYTVSNTDYDTIMNDAKPKIYSYDNVI